MPVCVVMTPAGGVGFLAGSVSRQVTDGAVERCIEDVSEPGYMFGGTERLEVYHGVRSTRTASHWIAGRFPTSRI